MTYTAQSMLQLGRLLAQRADEDESDTDHLRLRLVAAGMHLLERL